MRCRLFFLTKFAAVFSDHGRLQINPSNGMTTLIQAFNLLGALGLFIYGMVVMSGSVQRLTGSACVGP